jgi:mannose-6-phosphate isomerase
MPGRPTPPLVCRPLAIPRPWGGERAAAFADVAAPRAGGPIGEWWLLSTRDEHPTLVASAPFAGRPLTEVVASEGERLLGRALARRGRLPLLVKLLDTAAPLSVQVHPDEAALPGEGKTETWYVLDAQPDASLWLGLAEGVTVERFFQRVAEGGDPSPLLQRHHARPGLVAHLDAGVVHALGGGVVALEVQTSADTTYRIYDWHREPARQLHFERARSVARRDQRIALPQARPLRDGAPARDLLVECADYRFERLRIAAPTRLAASDDRFEILLPLGGALRLAATAGAVEVPRGHAALVPAGSGPLDLAPLSALSPTAPLELLRFVPGIGSRP